MRDIKKIATSFFWVLPFISFLFGYFFLFSFFHSRDIFVPNITGKSLQKAMRDVSKVGLFLRLAREKEDAELPPGTIIQQSPSVGKKSKPNQPIFVTLSKHPIATEIPSFVGKRYKEVLPLIKRLGARAKVFWLNSSYPKNFCMAQDDLSFYFSSGQSELFVFPDLKGKDALEVKSALESDGVSVEMVHPGRLWSSCDWSDKECARCKVTDQEPIAGAIINKKKKLYVQLQIR